MDPTQSGLILIDSSIWIDYYHPRGAPVLKRRLQAELERGAVATIGLIAVEVLQGAPTPAALTSLQEDFLGLHWLEVTQGMWLEVARLATRLRHTGTSVPATDTVIAAVALHYRCRLWHHDDDFTRIARQTSLALFSP